MNELTPTPVTALGDGLSAHASLIASPAGLFAWSFQGTLRFDGTRWVPLEGVTFGRTVVATPDGVRSFSASGECLHLTATGQITRTAGVAAGPAPTLGASGAAWDETNQMLVLFGGTSDSKKYEATTWEWREGAWKKRTLKVKPTARAHGAMLYVPTRRLRLLMGGMATGPVQSGFRTHLHFTDTAAYDEAGWQVWEPQPFPNAAPRPPSLLFFDAPTGQVVLGRTLQSSLALGLWRYGGAGQWVHHATVRFPGDAHDPASSQRFIGASFVFDPAARRLIAFTRGPTELAVVDLAPWLDALPSADWER